MDKRPRTDDDGPDAKRAFISPLHKQITPEELEQFQKEAIYRQLNVFRRERDALKAELEALQKSPDSDLKEIREQYLETLRLAERPVSEIDASKPASAAAPQSDAENNSAAPSSETKTTDTTELEEELAGKKGIIVAQKKQIKELQTQLSELEQKIRDLTLQLEAPSVETVQKSEVYKGVVAQVNTLSADNARMEQQFQASQAAAAEAKQQAQTAVFEARQASIDQIQQLEKKLETCESDVARLRAARDEKISEYNILKAFDTERSQALKNLDELIKLAEERAKNPSDATGVASDEQPDDIEGMDLEALREHAKKLAKKNKVLAGELPSLEQAYAKAHAKALLKIQDQASIEAKINAANVAKTRADEKFFGAMRSKDALAAEIQRYKSSLAKSAETLSALRAQETKMHAAAQRLEKQLADGDSRYTQLQRSQATLERRRTELETQAKVAEEQVHALKQQLRTRDEEVLNFQERIRSAEQNAEKYRKQLEIKRSVSGGGDVQEQLHSLRTIALCSLCTTNWKNTALKVCGHVFCSDCANKRLSSRMRKCPLCNSQFGHSDLLPVHL